MSVAHDLIIDQLSQSADGEQHLATWYTQGHADGVGDRLLMFDNTSAPSWEILRFRPALARDARFQAALKARIEQLASFRHPAFPLVRPLKGLGHEDGLAVVSTFAPGLRLSEAMKRPRSAAFAVRLIRQLVPALTALQQHAPGVFHGALDADRIVVTADGQLTIREHMIGSALASLELPAARLWSDFHILTSSASPMPVLDCRTDVVQLGLVVLSLMTGHRIGPEEYPNKVEGLLDEVAERNGRQSLILVQSLRYWLERALQLDEYMFESARDANDALAELKDVPADPDDFSAAARSTLPGAAGGAALGAERGTPCNRPRRQLIAMSGTDGTDKDPQQVPVTVEKTLFVEDTDSREAEDANPSSSRLPLSRPLHWAAVIVGAIAIAEAIFIVRLLYAPAPAAAPIPSAHVIESPRPDANVWMDDRVAAGAPLQLEVGPRAGSAGVLPTSGLPVEARKDKAIAAAPTISQRNGGFRLSAPFEVHVLDHERVLGSSADGPIIATAGRHELDLVNSAIGYRERRVVDIKAGQITTVDVAMPNGVLNINAVPWATVLIDGKSYGDTPIGNLSVPAGEHEIVFRHPQLGERREKTIVRANSANRVAVNLQR